MEVRIREVKKYMGMKTSGYFLAINDEGKIVGFRRWELHDDFYWTRELYVVPEMRKNLTDDAPKPSGEVEALGLRWKIL